MFGLLLYLLSSAYGAPQGGFYNEAREADGSHRAVYAQAMKRSSQVHFDYLKPSEQVTLALLLSPLGDGIQIHPIPLILNRQDNETLLRGSAQRGLALQRYFADLILGNALAFRSTQLPSPQLVERILRELKLPTLARLRQIWRKRELSDIHFLYGPDLLRRPDGSFVVVEDNVGPVGGFGDLGAIHESLLSQLPAGAAPGLPYPRNLNEQRSFIILRFIDNAMKKHAGGSGLILTPWTEESSADENLMRRVFGNDRENARIVSDFARDMRIMLEQTGYPKPTIDQVIEGLFARAILLPHGVFPEMFKTSSQVSHANRENIRSFFQKKCAILDFDSAWKDRHPIAEAEQRWLISQFEKSETDLFFSPGTEFLGHKALLPFLDQIIRFYQLGDPILATAPTRILPDLANQTGTLQETALELYRLSQHSATTPQVLKVANANHGEGVLILPEMTAAKRSAAFNRLARVVRTKLGSHQEPPLLIAQNYSAPSRLEAFAVDFRPIWFSAGTDELQGFDVPWGRAQLIRAGSQTKTNVSLGAQELAIFVEPNQSHVGPEARTVRAQEFECSANLVAAKPNPPTESASQSSVKHPFPQR